MKSERGIGKTPFIILIIVLILLAGVSFYVILQENGILEQELQKRTTNSVNEIK